MSWSDCLLSPSILPFSSSLLTLSIQANDLASHFTVKNRRLTKPNSFNFWPTYHWIFLAVQSSSLHLHPISHSTLPFRNLPPSIPLYLHPLSFDSFPSASKINVRLSLKYTQHQKQEPHTKLSLDPFISHLPVTAKLLQKKKNTEKNVPGKKKSICIHPGIEKIMTVMRNLKVCVGGESIEWWEVRQGLENTGLMIHEGF